VGTRKLTSFATTATGTISTSPNVVKFTNIITNDGVTYDASTGLATVLESGDYDISAQISINGTYALNSYSIAYLYVDGSELVRGAGIAGGAVSGMLIPVNAIGVRLTKGQTVGIYSQTNATTPTFNATAQQHWFSISKRSSPQQIAASEKVYARAALSANQTGLNPNSSYVKINLNSVTSDATATFNTSTYKYIVPADGFYRISGVISILSTNTIMDGYGACVYKNEAFLTCGPRGNPPSAGQSAGAIVSDFHRLSRGDRIELYLWGKGNNSVNTLTASSAAPFTTYLTLERMGN
jgi:hypothetical protein